MTIHAATLIKDALRRDVAILSTLAHLHCATLSQLHALCFPFHAVATARLTLSNLERASFVAHTTWRLKQRSPERGQVWTLTARGADLLQHYVPHVPPLARLDLACPSSAIEHEEWRVRLQLRTLLVRLLLEARTTALLHCITIQLPWQANWPTTWGAGPQPEPDALVSIVWHPADRLPADWLPWLDTPLLDGAICYPIYLERAHTRTSVTDLLPVWATTVPTHIPIVVLQDDDRYITTSRDLASLSQVAPLRLATWSALEGSITHEQWRDGHGAACGLRPLSESTVA